MKKFFLIIILLINEISFSNTLTIKNESDIDLYLSPPQNINIYSGDKNFIVTSNQTKTFRYDCPGFAFSIFDNKAYQNTLAQPQVQAVIQSVQQTTGQDVNTLSSYFVKAIGRTTILPKCDDLSFTFTNEKKLVQNK